MIELTQTLTNDDYRAAASVHYRTYPMSSIRPWLAACLIGVGVFLIASSTTDAFGFFAVAYGVYMLVRRRLWVNRLVKSAATAKLFGEPIRVHIDDNGTIHATQGDDSTQFNATNLFGFVRHDIGFLLYPQRNLFYYLKAAAFESQNQMNTFETLLKSFSVNQLKA